MSKELVPQAQELVEEQPVRIINVWNQKDRSQQEVHTAARTWGEFKREQKSEINFKNLRGVVRHNKNILEVDDAVLPEESFSMFLFPQKVKSGMRTREEYEKTFPKAKDLRAECVKRGLGSQGTKQDFLDKLVEADKKEEADHKKKPITVKPPIKSKAVAKAPKVPAEIVVAEKEETIFPATIEKATVTTEMTLRITDKNALGDLLAVQFPGMDVVEIDAMISLKATLVLGTLVATPAPAPAPVVEEEKIAKVEKPKAEEPKTSPKVESKLDSKSSLPPALADSKKKKKKKVHVIPTKKQFKNEADDMAGDFL